MPPSYGKIPRIKWYYSDTSELKTNLMTAVPITMKIKEPGGQKMNIKNNCSTLSFINQLFHWRHCYRAGKNGVQRWDK